MASNEDESAEKHQKRKQPSRSAKRKQLPWQGQEGWEAVHVGDGLLVGAAEGGFCGLEEFSPPAGMVIDDSRAAKYEKAATEDGSAGAKAGRKKKASANTSKKAPKIDGAPDCASEKLLQLQAQLAEVEAENKRLKATFADVVRTKAMAAGSESENDEAADKLVPSGAADEREKPLNSKQRKKLKRQAYLAEKDEARRNAQKEAKTPEAPATGQEQESPIVKLQNAGDEESRTDVTAWKQFEMADEIEAALAAMGFSQPTPIQRECLPSAIRDRRDIIGAAETGSGKTLAFGLPIIQALLEEKNRRQVLSEESDSKKDEQRRLRALILAPTRELAMQVSSHLQAVAKPCGVWVIPIVGGIAPAKQQRLLKVKPEVVVATPGRLWELMRNGEQHLIDMSCLSFLVLDEADRMAQQGHFEEMSSILDFVPRGERRDEAAEEQKAEQETEQIHEAERKKHRNLQTFVFSATLTMPEALRKRLRKGGGGASGSATLEALMEKIPFRDKPKIADLTSERRLAEKVVEARLECSEEDRDERLYYMLTQHPGRTLVFANAISMVRRLASILRLLQLPVTPLHASMQQRQRLKALDRFRKSSNAILVATDVAARGLDIQHEKSLAMRLRRIRLLRGVLSERARDLRDFLKVPAALDVYVHRCGRTARAEAEGISVALVTPKEAPRFAALLKALDRDAPPLFPLDHNLLAGAKRRVRLATRLEERLRLSSKQSADHSWRAQAAEAAGIELSDEEDAGGNANNGAVQALQEELAKLLQEPLQPRYSQRYFAGAPSAALAGKVQGGTDGEEEGGQQDHASEAISQAVRLATQLAGARKTAATASKTKKQRNRDKQKGPAQQRGKAVVAALAAKKAKKAASGKSRFVVIPGAVARETQGPGALEALRRKLSVV